MSVLGTSPSILVHTKSSAACRQPSLHQESTVESIFLRFATTEQQQQQQQQEQQQNGPTKGKKQKATALIFAACCE
jgi:hypothetical protein